ncbi:MAG TPA: hypothetical protein VKB41_11380 [Steroidobacteraceae bacterium]|jgi:hypothetical protein|nr:hypothetical protein [Steroidobacteraceae bacterium]
MKTSHRIASFLVPLALPLAAFATEPATTLAQLTAQNHSINSNNSFSPLVDKVRRATAKYRDINVMFAEGGWKAATPCVSGPNSGAMGVHFLKDGRVGDGILKPDEPEALIFQPMANGAMRLVGVEFIELKDVWDSIGNGGGKQPTLEGQLLNLVTEPNRYTLHAFYELHVWAWQDNPDGFFADWNSNVNCNKATD